MIAKRVSLLHLKDYRIGRIDLTEEDFKDRTRFNRKFQNIVQFAELGQGSLDIKTIVEAGLKSGARYFLIERTTHMPGTHLIV
ncbi:hypothetical protein NDK43_20585 [Neobacillus pocheonensis]|uniref:Uncharacterized protein n=1 Tax=Neobacillus pocheonensis TaxID=363869 RepID=A0ABT0WDB8_9BACI|nr:hypothetical protein [Neobacillus pocheonensis]